MSEEYNLTFLEAMKALCEGKDVKNEIYPWVYYNSEGRPLFEGYLDKVTDAVFNEKEQKAKWKVVE